MSETETALTDYALSKLRQLAAGNGIKPDAITIFSADEKTVPLGGTMLLTPKTDTTVQRFTGRAAGVPKGSKSFSNFTELTTFAKEEQKTYAESEEWFEAIKTDIDALPGTGWGLETAYVTHDQKAPVSAFAEEPCPTCEGKAHLLCNVCLGRRYNSCPVCQERGVEPCYNCYGSGREPGNQDQYCRVCNGSLQAICRTCQGQRGIPCAQCKATGNIPCAACEGSGKLVEVCTVKFGADLSFSVNSGAELPTALRRAFDRHGIGFITKGHADISYTKPEDDQKPGHIKLLYTAQIPCADLVVRFNGENKRIAVFGHKRVMLEVPPFLDHALADGIATLTQAAKGGALDRALEYRALHDACRLILTGQGDLKNLRRLYPYGLSKDTGEKILRLMRAALHRTTIAARYSGALLSLLLAAGIGAGLYFTPHTQFGAKAALGIEIGAALCSAAGGYLLTSKAAQFKLHKLFPDIPQKRARLGGTLALIAALVGFALPFGMAFLHPETAVWLHQLGLIKHS